VTLRSGLYLGHIMHARLHPIRHVFTYPFYIYDVDLAELPELHRRFRWFSYNRPNLVSFHTRDYLQPGPGDLLAKVNTLLDPRGHAGKIARVRLITAARYFNYVFNPVSLFYCFDEQGGLRCAIAEVRNTFHEKQLYILDDALPPERGSLGRYRARKELFVSPFNTLQGEYDFHLSPLGETLDVRVNLTREGLPIVVTRLSGRRVPLTTSQLVHTLARFPLTAALTLPRIGIQALRLRQRGLKDVMKPKPESPLSFKV
jgi:cyclopropane-fatty-acyl-phospholipid synthase